jgi:hypothetical protein
VRRSYNILIHKTFGEQIKDVVQKHPKIENALATTLREIRASPTFGKMMKDVRKPKLRGVIRRAHVGGRKGHRLIYLHPLKSEVVIPVLLSPDPRSSFDYDNVPWQEISDEIYRDFVNKNYDAFINWTG